MGFAVFHLGEVPGLGKVRFHMWPQGLRIALDGQPAIHSHPSDMCSLVIAGSYEDTLYRVKESACDSPGSLQCFQAIYASDEESEIYPISKWYDAEKAADRTVTRAQFHHIPAGVLHATRIPINAFATTLVVTGESIDAQQILLLGDGTVGRLAYERPVVTSDQYAHMTGNLVQAMLGEHDDALPHTRIQSSLASNRGKRTRLAFR